MSKIKVTLFRHTSSEDLGSFHRTLQKRGADIHYVTTPRDDFKDMDALEPDLLLIMGGAIGVYQADLYPFLNDEIDVIKKRIAADRPTFGICLGSQLIAKALGSEVYKGKNGKELGWNPLMLTDNAKGTEFEHFAPEKTNMFHWHGDTFDFPEGATLMASSDRYKNQMYTYGENICGLQCHPEVTPKGLEEWWVSHVNEVTGPNPLMPIQQIRIETARHAEKLDTQSRAFFNAWLDKRGL